MNQSSKDTTELTSVSCPACGSSEVSSRTEVEKFQYGDIAEVAVTLSASIQIHHCESCDFAFTVEDASEAKHDAVCRHLKVLTPSEVRRVRDQYSFSQADFSEVSKIGKASLARWESGVLIQNQANDSLLYLLTFPENMTRLRERSLPQSKIPYALEGNVILFRPKFKALPDAEMQRLYMEAERFQLFPEVKEG